MEHVIVYKDKHAEPAVGVLCVTERSIYWKKSVSKYVCVCACVVYSEECRVREYVWMN